MLQTIQGIYRNGKIELAEVPQNITESQLFCFAIASSIFIKSKAGIISTYAMVALRTGEAIASGVRKVYLTGGSFSSMPNLLPISITSFVKPVMLAMGAATTVAAVSKASRPFWSLGKLRSFSGF